MTTTTAPNPTDAMARSFDALDAESPVHALRAEAFDAFRRLGLPTMKDEDWRYTSIKPIAGREFVLGHDGADRITPDVIARHFLKDTPCHQFVFVNGRYAPQLSDLGDAEGGETLKPLSEMIAGDFATLRRHLAEHTELDREAFSALNTAFIEEGVYLHVPAGLELEQPVHLVFLTTPDGAPIMTHPRILIVAEANTKATIVETYAAESEGEYFTNAVTEIVAGENATIDHYKIQRESSQAFHVSSLNVHQSGSSNVTSHNFSVGGRLVRNNVNARLAAAGCESVFNGLVMGNEAQHIDNHLRIDHLMPNCHSWEYYKNILDDRARGVFCGRIYVAPDAQRTDAKQTSANLLLSDDADVTTKPQLEIFADDVKCTHGATIGQIEESQLFYLQSRGIGKIAAKSMLIYAFANETISEIRVEEIRLKLEQLLLERLPGGRPDKGGR